MVARLLVATVFVYAGAIKAANPAPFADSIASFKMLPASLSNLLALGLPPFEILAGLLLLVPNRWRRIGAFCILLMISAFLVALATALARGLKVDCGCFGGSSLDLLSPTRNLWLALGRDLVLGTVAWFLYHDAWHAPRPVSVAPPGAATDTQATAI